MSDTAKLGQIHDTPQGRDAVHVAVAPVVAAQILKPGDHIGLVPGSVDEVMQPNDVVPAIGVVDPFLKGYVAVGQRFFLFLYPQTITGLRHVWSHPAFAEGAAPAVAAMVDDAKARSEAWLRNWVRDSDCPSYEALIGAATGKHVPAPEGYGGSEAEIMDYGSGDIYMLIRGSDACGHIPDDVWDHVEMVTGQKVTRRATAFSCSC